MSDSLFGFLLIAIPLFFTGLVNLVIAWKSNNNQIKTLEKQTLAAEKLTEIHTSTNGTLSEMKKEAAASAEEIKGLKALIAQMIESKKEIKIISGE